MSYGCVVYASMEIRNKDVIDKIDSCIFKNPDYVCVTTEDIYTRVSSDTLIDIAKLIGVRDELAGMKLDQKKFNKVAISLGIQMNCEFVHVCLNKTTYEKYGYATLTLPGFNGCHDWLFRYISRLTPTEVYEVEEEWEDYGYHCSYKLRNGEDVEDDENAPVKKDDNNLSFMYDEAMHYAYKDKYEVAIVKLLPLAKKGFKNSRNDLAVCFERMGIYEEAKKWYEKDDSDLAKQNLLNLYYNKKIRFSKNKYLNICNYFMERNDPRGYHEMFGYYAYSGLVKQDYKQAFDYLLLGTINCCRSNLLIFDLGYCYEKGIGVEVDNVRSHKYYGMIVDCEGERVTKYNYALQCYQGRGCEKDIQEAIKYFEQSASQGYKDAMRYLVEIYNSDEYKNETKYQYYKSKL